MSKIDWYVEGSSFAACNCIYACPCQFEALPTHGNCRGFEALRIVPQIELSRTGVVHG